MGKRVEIVTYQRLSEISDDLISSTEHYPFVRTVLFSGLEPPQHNVSILKGARGIGKSTLLQQFLLKKRQAGAKVIYLSADSTLLTATLAEFAQEYYRRGGEYLAIDEIHKYKGWQAEVKTIIDAFPKLKVIASGSSSLNLDYASADLSRRHVMLCAKGLSFREYLHKNNALDLEIISLKTILSFAEEAALQMIKLFQAKRLDLLALFKHYLQEGYFLTRDNYPTTVLYYDSLLNSINSVIESDLSTVHQDIDHLSRNKIKQVLKHIAMKCPFMPNIAELSRNLDIANDNSLKKYLYYLNEGEVLVNLYSANKSHKDFQKPQKIFLNNTNFAYAYCDTPSIGTIRETFAANCLYAQGELTAPPFGDFCLDNQYTFEIGGRNKKRKQIKAVENSFIFADDILSVENQKIPLWLLGFLW